MKPYRTQNGVTYYGEELPFVAPPSDKTGAQLAGLRYEKQAHEYFGPKFGKKYRANRWFRADGAVCQPDAYIVFSNRIIVLEMKIRALPEHWHQIEHYREVLSCFYSRPSYGYLVSRSFDPWMDWSLFDPEIRTELGTKKLPEENCRLLYVPGLMRGAVQTSLSRAPSHAD